MEHLDNRISPCCQAEVKVWQMSRYPVTVNGELAVARDVTVHVCEECFMGYPQLLAAGQAKIEVVA